MRVFVITVLLFSLAIMVYSQQQQGGSPPQQQGGGPSVGGFGGGRGLPRGSYGGGGKNAHQPDCNNGFYAYQCLVCCNYCPDCMSLAAWSNFWVNGCPPGCPPPLE